MTLPPGRARLSTRPVPSGSRAGHNDGYRRRRSFRGVHGRRLGSNNDIDLETNQFGGQFRETTELVIGRTKLNLEVLADDISEFAQPVIELGSQTALGLRRAKRLLWVVAAARVQ